MCGHGTTCEPSGRACCRYAAWAAMRRSPATWALCPVASCCRITACRASPRSTSRSVMTSAGARRQFASQQRAPCAGSGLGFISPVRAWGPSGEQAAGPWWSRRLVGRGGRFRKGGVYPQAPQWDELGAGTLKYGRGVARAKWRGSALLPQRPAWRRELGILRVAPCLSRRSCQPG